MASKLYYNPETAISFKSSGGDVAFTPTSLANNAGRVSAQYDRGSGAKPGLYRWRLKTKAAAALTVGNVLEIYLAQTDDPAIIPGNIGSSDAALATADKRRNLGPMIGSVNADSTTNGEVQHTTGVCFIYGRYLTLVWFNALGQALSGTAGDHEFVLTPIPPEMQ